MHLDNLLCQFGYLVLLSDSIWYHRKKFFCARGHFDNFYLVNSVVIKKFVKFTIFFLIFQLSPYIWPICCVNLATIFQVSRQTATSYFDIINPKKLVKSLFIIILTFCFLIFQLKPSIWPIYCVNLATKDCFISTDTTSY